MYFLGSPKKQNQLEILEREEKIEREIDYKELVEYGDWDWRSWPVKVLCLGSWHQGNEELEICAQNESRRQFY